MIYDMIDVRMHMFDLLVKPTSKTLMFGATGPTLKCSMRFPIINFQKMKLDVSGFSSAFKAPCFLLVEGVSLSHGAFIKDMELLDFTSPPWPHIFTSREENSLRRQVGDLLGYHGSSCFLALCSSRHISKTPRKGDIGLGGCEL